jgi:hypothetical protein
LLSLDNEKFCFLCVKKRVLFGSQFYRLKVWSWHWLRSGEDHMVDGIAIARLPERRRYQIVSQEAKMLGSDQFSSFLSTHSCRSYYFVKPALIPNKGYLSHFLVSMKDRF